jgi:16S rRNA (cytosine967-C5)-methyltransferase
VRVLVTDVLRAAREGRLPPGHYHRILLDAPCTASGIVRRHPDIPWLRRPEDVAQLPTQQARLLDALWPLLAPAGRLLFAVCSVFSEEGSQQIQRFVARTPGARLIPLPVRGDSGRLVEPTVQLVPAETEAGTAEGWPGVHDGFFYALLEKQS